ncbi:peptidase M28-like protein [Chitinophaga niastensis]|uniref:Peptidase M28-like protein n=1 Tax=Chitinophaga niastensis TaxID=536980 RepID=A0A2P8HRC8_CHINA|nr:M20/M25/M40 family metallo-hydrolase [Chitinophaga niastensis]PSL48779.1 peptidase M28-like protein [Chitinophaga niastensis]
MRKSLLLLLATGCITVAGYAQQIKEKEVARIIGTLAADDMQGRFPGTPGIEKAAQFISGEFEKAGLQPLPGEKGFLEEFSKYSLQQSSVSFTVSGQQKDWPVIPLGNSRSFNWEKDTNYAVVHVKDPGELIKILYSADSVKKNTLVWMDASLVGYLGNIRASFSEHSYDSIAQLERVAVNAPKKQVILAFEKEPVADTASWSIHIDRTIKSTHFANVGGMIKGSTKPDEYVVFSGHYDHLGILPAVAGDSIANGADDDASGTTAVIMLSKYFKQLHPARSVIFVAFTAEESGGYGSRYFSKKQDPDKVVAMFNIEMIGKESKFGKNSAFITGFEKSDFGPILQRNLKGSTFNFYPDPYPEQGLFYRSDNATLARLGVPAHTISTTQIDKDKFYHTVGDEVKTLDITNITDIIKAIAVSSTSIVNGTDTPTRIAKESSK